MSNISTFGGLSENKLLSALPANDFYNLLSSAELVSLSFRETLYAPGAQVEYVYFPLDAVISLVSTLNDGKSLELAMVGCEGLTGIHDVLGFDSNWYECIVQVPGRGLKIETEVIREQLKTNPAFSALLLQYLNALYVQISQAAICTHLHKLEQRLRTWLSMLYNRAKTDEIALTQNDIAVALGYQRPTVITVTNRLQEKEIISHRRGRIRIIDSQRLKETCECYQIMETQYDKIFAKSLHNPLPHDGKKLAAKIDFPPSTGKSNKSLDRHLYDVQSILIRVRKSCEATELHCRQQTELIAKQREELKLM